MPSFYKYASILVSLVLLAGCGGGSSSDNAQSTTPSLSLTADAPDSYEGQRVLLSTESSDSDGSALSATLSCDDGLLEDTTLTLPATNDLLVINCEASASTADGTILTDEITITVSPITLTISSDFSDLQEYKVVVAAYQGPDIEEGDITVSLNSTPITFEFVDGQIIVLPEATSEITDSLVFTTPHVNYTHEDKIDTVVPPANPLTYVTSYLNQQLTDVNNSSYSDPVKALIEAEITDALASLSSLSSSELEVLATYISLNLEPVIQGTGLVRATALPPGCPEGIAEGTVGITMLGIGGFGLAVSGGLIGTGLGAKFGLVAGVASLVYAGIGLYDAITGFDRAIDACAIIADFAINSTTGSGSQSFGASIPTRTAIRSNSLIQSTGTSSSVILPEAVATELVITARKETDPEARPDLNSMYSKITGFIDSLNEYLGASIDKEVRSPSDIDDTFYPDSASQYAMNFTLPNTTANVASGESFIVTLTKDDKNLSTPSHLVNTEFELTVTHNEEELSKTVTATFEPDISTFTVSYNIAESEGTVVQTGRPLEYDQDGDGNPDATFNSGSLCDGDLAGSSFNEDYIFNLSSCDSNGDCILTLYSPEEGSFPGRDFNVESSNISIDFDEGEPTLADDPVELNGREYRVFIGGTESINVSVDRNTLALTGTLIDDDIWTWELDDDELICTYTKTITGTPISCTSSGPANCGVIGIP